MSTDWVRLIHQNPKLGLPDDDQMFLESIHIVMDACRTMLDVELSITLRNGSPLAFLRICIFVALRGGVTAKTMIRSSFLDAGDIRG